MRIISGRARGTKLYTLEGTTTRPTLDRVKEPLFNIINFDLQDANVLDLFAGSGALGLEAVSRGAKKVVFSENNYKAIEIVEKNISKTKFENETILIKKDFEKALDEIKKKDIKFDIVFLDPPYKMNYIYKSLVKILDLKLLNEGAIFIVETDEPDRVHTEINNVEGISIFDERKYGRVTLMFLKEISE